MQINYEEINRESKVDKKLRYQNNPNLIPSLSGEITENALSLRKIGLIFMILGIMELLLIIVSSLEDMYILTYALLIIDIIMIIVFMIEIGNLIANTRSEKLKKFRNLLIISYIFFYFFVIVFQIVAILAINLLFSNYVYYDFYISEGLVFGGFFLCIAAFIIQCFIRYKAWSNLSDFFTINHNIIDTPSYNKIIQGISIIKKGSILSATLILLPIGEIVEIVGVLMLGAELRQLFEINLGDENYILRRNAKGTYNSSYNSSANPEHTIHSSMKNSHTLQNSNSNTFNHPSGNGLNRRTLRHAIVGYLKVYGKLEYDAISALLDIDEKKAKIMILELVGIGKIACYEKDGVLYPRKS
ncbi:MAG: hypothetical protein GF364_15880 [Candidatus Lokiarchaeota archaeon]|nr:hypothetical protein [Candidatus Lokiarchaeota archaeon]